jgi:methyl-accepting chemotaxis protein
MAAKKHVVKSRRAAAKAKASGGGDDAREMKAKLEALDRVQAIIEFDLDGTVRHANENFLRTLGYTLDEIKGQHHKTFCDPAYVASDAYQAFWAKLRRGEYDAGVYRRLGKGGKEVWIQAAYNPILDPAGKPYKVVKFATDITTQKNQTAEFEGKVRAIDRAQAVIEFNLDGTVITANANFLAVLGYSLDDVRGKHHRMFCDPSYVASPDYELFWAKLRRGDLDAGIYRRIGRGNKEVWIQATYNPILDAAGKPYKVVKFATDVTPEKKAQMEIDALVRAASEGRLSDRIEASRYEGAMRQLGDAVNRLMDAVVRPLRDATGVLNGLAAGDLTAAMGDDYQGEFAQLRDAINQSMAKLRDVVLKIGDSARAVTHASGDIADGNTSLSKRTQEQASALQETAASLEEMTATVKQNASNATQADQLAAGARDAAEKGGQVVGSAVGAMTAITEASKRVADIIGVIEQIAFQTNMLALNAAVEAARAGDQGRGFAVVASEVRNLAQRSAAAAKEIKTLIQDSNEKVDQGSKLVNRSGETLQEIVSSVKKVSDIIGEINSASEQQAAGIDQINSAVAQMDKGTQENAAMVEEAAAAAESMREQAQSMAELMSFFRAGDGDGAATASPAAPSNGRSPGAGRGKAPGPGAATPARKPAATAGSGPARQPAPRNGHHPAAAGKAAADSEWKEF